MKVIKSHIIAIILSLFMVVGSLRFIFGIEQYVYFVFSGILFLLFFTELLRKKIFFQEIKIYLFLGSGFILWLLTSFFWTISSIQWREDFVLLLGLLFLLVLVSYTLNYYAVELFKNYMVISCGIVGILIIYFTIYSTGRIFGIRGYNTLVNEFYLSAGDAVAAGFIISAVNFFLRSSRRFFWACSSIFFMLALSISLSRGALIFSILLVLFLIFLVAKINLKNVKIIKKYFLRYLFFILPIIVGLIYLALNVERTQSRLIRILSVREEIEQGGRGLLWDNAWEGISHSPILGYGLGSNGLISGGNEEVYPHNMFLQVWLDGGIVAFILSILFLTFPIFLYFKNIRKTKYDANCVELLLLYIYFCLIYSKSGNFYTARSLVISGALLASWISFKNSVAFMKNSLKI